MSRSSSGDRPASTTSTRAESFDVTAPNAVSDSEKTMGSAPASRQAAADSADKDAARAPQRTSPAASPISLASTTAVPETITASGDSPLAAAAPSFPSADTISAMPGVFSGRRVPKPKRGGAPSRISSSRSRNLLLIPAKTHTYLKLPVCPADYSAYWLGGLSHLFDTPRATAF